MEEVQVEKSLEKLEVDDKMSEPLLKKIQPEETEKTKCFTTEVQPTRKNKDEKVRKKDDRSVEQVLKALSSLGTNEEKLATMCKKYSDIVDENRKLSVQVKQYEKKVLALQREKEQLQVEQGKTVLTRSRLESLCRELQKQNKQIKEESWQRIKEEEEKRKAVSGKFQSTLGEITLLMQQNNENNSKLRDENLEMQNKFKTVCEQYELRGQQVEKMTQQMKLESQLAEAKLTKLKVEMVAEKELLENEKKQLLIELAAYQHKCQELQKAEATLKNQISMYTEKYDKFQGALAKSNELYGGFKAEMGQMSDKIAKLEKETTVWKTRWENNHKTLLQVAAEKQQKAAELSLAAKQLTQLQKLCRTLQADRTSLLMQLKSEGITPKLSGAANASAEDEPESRPDEKLQSSSSPAESEIVENGKNHNERPSPDDEHPAVIETNESKESTTAKIQEEAEREIEEDNDTEQTEGEGGTEQLSDGKGDEFEKVELEKAKKGKEGSKRRKK